MPPLHSSLSGRQQTLKNINFSHTGSEAEGDNAVLLKQQGATVPFPANTKP